MQSFPILDMLQLAGDPINSFKYYLIKDVLDLYTMALVSCLLQPKSSWVFEENGQWSGREGSVRRAKLNFNTGRNPEFPNQYCFQSHHDVIWDLHFQINNDSFYSYRYLKLAVSRKMEVAWGTGKNLQFSLSQSVTKCSLFPCYLLAQVLAGPAYLACVIKRLKLNLKWISSWQKRRGTAHWLVLFTV